MSRNPFTNWLADLRRPDGPAPKRLTNYQFYMSHPDFKAAVDQKFREDHWDVPREQHLQLRCAVAKAMYAKESEEVHDRIRREVEEEFEDEKSRYRNAAEGLPSYDAEDQKE